MAEREDSLSQSPMLLHSSMLFPSCVQHCEEIVWQKQKNECPVVAYLLQLVQRGLSNTALLEVVLGRIHHLLDDLLVDIALFSPH